METTGHKKGKRVIYLMNSENTFLVFTQNLNALAFFLIFISLAYLKPKLNVLKIVKY